MIDLNKVGVNPNDEADKAMLADLQGNILNGHGRNMAKHIFISFKAGKEVQARTWTQNELSKQITSMLSQLQERAKIESGQITKAESSTFVSFMLSASGYNALGFDKNNMPEDEQFQGGMKEARAKLNDPLSDTWDAAFQDNVDAVIIVADNFAAALETRANELIQAMSEFADVLHVQMGQGLKNDAGLHIEHFGYVDGTSQPKFLADKIQAEQSAHGEKGWSSAAPLSLALVKDKLGNSETSTGSYCVYRKLHQNVADFHEAEQNLATAINAKNPDQPPITDEQAGALAVGRFRDGTPVTNFFTPQGSAKPDNNFIYSSEQQGDQDGRKCPFQSHIRKTNPRFDSVTGEGIGIEGRPDTTISRENELSHRIVRRGIPFGKPGKSDVGLIFICFQGNIERQFEFMQLAWANNPNFVRNSTGVDPVVGQPSGQNTQQWKMWNQPQSQAATFDMSNFVTMRGGEYFFAPSLTFLQTINDKALELTPTPAMGGTGPS